MNWPELSIIAAFFWAVNNLFDKYVIMKTKNNMMPLMMFTLIISAIVALIVGFVFGIMLPSNFMLILNVSTGVIWVFALFTYYKALANEDVTRVIPIIYTVPMFVAILAFIFLGEKFTILKYVGIVTMVIGSIIVGTEKLTQIKLS